MDKVVFTWIDKIVVFGNMITSQRKYRVQLRLYIDILAGCTCHQTKKLLPSWTTQTLNKMAVNRNLSMKRPTTKNTMGEPKKKTTLCLLLLTFLAGSSLCFSTCFRFLRKNYRKEKLRSECCHWKKAVYKGLIALSATGFPVWSTMNVKVIWQMSRKTSRWGYNHVNVGRKRQGMPTGDITLTLVGQI